MLVFMVAHLTAFVAVVSSVAYASHTADFVVHPHLQPLVYSIPGQACCFALMLYTIEVTVRHK